MTAKSKDDRRVQRTRERLYDALLDLIIEKGYQAITVQDIIDRANIGRSTFYSHFADKEQLLINCIDQLHKFLKQQSANHSLSKIPEHRFGFSLAMLQHVQSHKLIYNATIGEKGCAPLMPHILHMLTDLAREEIATLLPNSTLIPSNIVLEYVVNTFLILLTWWMDQKMPCPAATIDEIFHRLVFSGLIEHHPNVQQR